MNCRDKTRPSISYPWNARDDPIISTLDWQKPVLLSSNMTHVLEYLGLDSEIYVLGFSKEEEIWTWLISSPYFDIDIYKRHISIMEEGADLKSLRSTYRRFLQFLSTNAIELHYRAKLPNPVVFFSKETDVLEIVDEYQRHLGRKEKFSGRLLLELGVEKQCIGAALSWIKAYHKRSSETPDSMETWLDSNSEETVRAWTVTAVGIWLAES